MSEGSITKRHWEDVYATRAVDAVSWYQREPARSLASIARTGVARSAPIIDVGAGASMLVDALLDEGYTDLTALDISAGAMAIARARLGERAAGVRWIESDIRDADLPAAHYALWHDRAAFHFLTDAADRAAYVGNVRRALRPDGHLVIATFAEDGPSRCSGLDVVRYDADALAGELGAGFERIRAEKEMHTTPGGAAQSFLFAVFRRTAAR